MMNKIDQLLQKHCPEGVLKVPLGTIVSINDGHPFRPIEYKAYGSLPLIRITNLKEGNVTAGNVFVDIDESEYINSMIYGGEILVSMSGSTGKSAYNKIKGVVNQRIAIIKAKEDKTNNHYLRHILLANSFTEYCMSNATGQQNNISKTIINRYQVPLPPLPVQEEIVRILDEFSEYTTSLTKGLPAEIDLRKKQYEYYRNQLLTF